MMIRTPMLVALGWVSLSAGNPASAEVLVLDFAETPAPGLLSVAAIPELPESHVIDADGLLDATQKARVENALKGQTLAPAFFVLQRGPLPTETASYANELLKRWTTGGGRLAAMVLAVQQPLPKTHVILAGRGLDRTDIEHLQELGRASLNLAPSTTGLTSGAVEILDGLIPAVETFAEAYGKSSLLAQEPPNQEGITETPLRETKTTSHWDLLAAKLDWNSVRVVAAIIGGVLVLGAAVLLLPRFLRRRRLRFPEHEPRTRFSAPFGGGSNAQIRYGPEGAR